jgi:hypothetical protein
MCCAKRAAGPGRLLRGVGAGSAGWACSRYLTVRTAHFIGSKQVAYDQFLCSSVLFPAAPLVGAF